MASAPPGLDGGRPASRRYSTGAGVSSARFVDQTRVSRSGARVHSRRRVAAAPLCSGLRPPASAPLLVRAGAGPADLVCVRDATCELPALRQVESEAPAVGGRQAAVDQGLEWFIADRARRLAVGRDRIRSAVPGLERRVRERGSGGGFRELRIFGPIAWEDLRTLEQAKREIATPRTMLEQLPGNAPGDGTPADTSKKGPCARADSGRRMLCPRHPFRQVPPPTGKRFLLAGPVDIDRGSLERLPMAGTAEPRR